MAKLKPGDKAPEFELADQHDKTVRLRDFAGQKVLVYFYPKADTPGCTTQACSIRDARQDLADLGLAVAGISPDDPKAQAKFDAKYNLDFPLLSDADHAVAEAYGVWDAKKPGIVRSSFLIDEEGVVIHTWYKVSPEETVPKAKESLETEAK